MAWAWLFLAALAGPARAEEPLHSQPSIQKSLAQPLGGSLVYHTKSLCHDGRIDAPTLGIKRDLIVYLPPGYDSTKSYPLLIWLHGFGGDEKQFPIQVVSALDAAIRKGHLPPMVAASPDGSRNRSSFHPAHSGSWFLNTKHGDWETYLVRDVMQFLYANYSIHKEPEAHAIGGWSMGGFSAYNVGMKHPEVFRSLIGIYANLDLRYADCHGSTQTNYDPHCYRRIETLNCRTILGYYPDWRFPVTTKLVYGPVFGKGRDGALMMSRESPVEMLERLDIRPGQFEMYVAYGGKDNYNIDAQSDSFLDAAGKRGLCVWSRFNPEGQHRWDYVNECLPDVFKAVGARLFEILGELDHRAGPAGQPIPQ